MRPEKQSTDEQHALAHLRGLHPDLAAPLALFTSFAVVLRERAVKEPTAQRDQWMTDAASSEVAEMRAFATNLRQNRGAAVAALTLPYSQGQTEGRVTKLKRVKRAMYGRATFDLTTRLQTPDHNFGTEPLYALWSARTICGRGSHSASDSTENTSGCPTFRPGHHRGNGRLRSIAIPHES